MVSIRVRSHSSLHFFGCAVLALCCTHRARIVHGKMSENKKAYCCRLFEIETQGERIEAKRERERKTHNQPTSLKILFFYLTIVRSAHVCLCVVCVFLRLCSYPMCVCSEKSRVSVLDSSVSIRFASSLRARLYCSNE